MGGRLRRRRIMQRMGSVDKIKKLSNRYCSYGVLLEIVNAIYVVIIIPCTILLSSTLTKMLVIGITVVIGIFGFILGYLLDMYEHNPGWTDYLLWNYEEDRVNHE